MPIVLLGLAGCASAPEPFASTTDLDAGFTTLREQDSYRLAVFRSQAPWVAAPTATIPVVQLRPDAYTAPVTAEDAELVARHLGRSLCVSLAPYVHWQAAASSGQHSINAQILRIAPTRPGLAIASALFDAAVPGPFRLPAGLGGLSADVFWRDDTGQLLFGVRWARGANPLLQQARVSVVGDAWGLAPAFARDVRKSWRDDAPPRLSQESAKASRGVCDAAFGTVAKAGRAASLFIPLSPAALEPR